mgnify:CR=1 FL=1
MLVWTLVASLLVIPVALMAAPLRVSPEIEGLYEIQNLRKSKRTGEPPRVVIMNTLSDRGATISISDPDLGYPNYVFGATRVESGGQLIEGINLSHRMSEIRAEIDSSGTLNAWLRDPTQGPDKHIVAKLKYRTASLFKEPGASLPPKYVEGKFLRLGTPLGKLYLYPSPTIDGLWRAQIVYDVGVSTKFQFVNVDLSTRTIELVHERSQRGEYMKWVVAIEVDEETEAVTLKGMWFDNFYGRAEGLQLNKIPAMRSSRTRNKAILTRTNAEIK